MRRLVFYISLVFLAACGTKPGDGEIRLGDFSEEHLKAADYALELDTLRLTLVGALPEGEIDEATFEQVCKPVGMRAQELTERTGWVVQQLAVKYRNPMHKADEKAVELIENFKTMPELQDVWEKVTMEGHTGWRYFLPIRVSETCLACHGAKESRPTFIVDGYPDDLAYDFKVGDLRGVYSIFIPDSTSTETMEGPSL